MLCLAQIESAPVVMHVPNRFEAESRKIVRDTRGCWRLTVQFPFGVGREAELSPNSEIRFRQGGKS
jgi:hypothetical protein